MPTVVATDGLPVKPQGPPPIYTTSWDATQSSGFYKSVDDGGTWHQITLPDDVDDLSHIGVGPSFAVKRTMVAGSGWGGVLMSDDGGDRWWTVRPTTSDLRSSGQSNVTSTSFSSDLETVVLSTSYQGLMKSTDRGHLWSNVQGLQGLGAIGADQVVLSPAYQTDQTIYVRSGTE
jgi:photosystem II stability/assembly factor-like uncharacterized protein